MTQDAIGVAHLHLSHPFVQRMLGRFLAQGWSAHDLARVTAVRNPYDGIARVIAFGRLSLFGAGATRLHDQLVSVAAPWTESGGGNHLRPFAEEADRKALDRLRQLPAAAPTPDGLDAPVPARLVGDGEVAQKAQWAQDRKGMGRRLERLAAEMEREPAELPALYRVATRKLEPVGMVYLWPGTR